MTALLRFGTSCGAALASLARFAPWSRALLLLLVATPAYAYDVETHVGLTERAAQSAKLHDILYKHWGRPLGLLEPLRGPKSQAIGRLNPVEGLRPDDRGENSALGWLLAGAALADSPPENERNHFFEATTGRGLHDHGTWAGIFFWFFGDREVGGSFDGTGKAAPDWVVDAKNPLSVQVALDALEKSAAAPAPDERNLALAQALLTMGAVAHALEDMGSPSHVRNDFRKAHLEGVPGSSVWDRRSLYERYVALRYGRLGVPGPSGPPEQHAKLRDYFSTLATWTAPRFFSPGTLPQDVDCETPADLDKAVAQANATLKYGAPRIGKIDPKRFQAGVLPQVAYENDHGVLRFSLDERVYAGYARVALPRTAQAAAGLMAFFVRGRMSIARDGDAVVAKNEGVAFGKGTLTLYAEDGGGKRRAIGTGERANVPGDAKRIIAVFRGVDNAGEPLVAIEDVPLPSAGAPDAGQQVGQQP